MFPVPENCPICGSPWIGGYEIPDKPMKEGLRVFYECGCSVSIVQLNEGYQLLIKNCQNDED